MPDIFTLPRQWAAQATGAPYAGAQLYFYQAGTLIQQSVYQDAGIQTAHAQPVVAPDDGKWPVIYLNPNATADYRVILRTSAGVLIDDLDNIPRSSFSLTSTAVSAALNSLARTPAEISVDITPTDASYEPGHPKRFGVVGDGSTDDTAALQRWATVPGYKFGIPVTCKVSGQISFNRNETIDFRGMTIDGSSGTSFANNAVCYVSGALMQISALNASPTLLSRDLSFSSLHTLSENDVGIIYNPTNSSFSTARTYYRAGEYFKVEAITSTTAVKVWNGLYAAYTAANVNVYKMTANAVNWKNLTVKAPNSGLVSPVLISLATRVRLHDVTGSGSAYTAINLDRCYDVETTGGTGSVNVQAVANKYSLSIGNCQDVRIIGNQFESVRHSINIGGDDLVCAVPNRNIRISHATLKNDSAYVSESAADIHGNCHDVRYESCSIWGGAGINGIDVAYINCKFYEHNYASGAMILTGSEWLGGRIDIDNCDLRATPGTLYALGMIQVYSGANAVSDTHVNIRNCTVDTGATDVFARAALVVDTYKVNMNIDGVTFRGSAALTNICRMVGAGSTGDSDYVSVENIVGAPSGAVLYTAASGFGAATRVKLMRQSGTVAVTPVSGANTADSTAVTFRYSYGSKTPNIVLGQDQAFVNSKAVNVRVKSAAASGFTANLFTCDAANFGATSPVVNVTWIAGTSE